MLKPISCKNTGMNNSRARSGYTQASHRSRNSSVKSNNYIIRAMSSRTNSRTHGNKPVYSKMTEKDALAIKHD